MNLKLTERHSFQRRQVHNFGLVASENTKSIPFKAERSDTGVLKHLKSVNLSALIGDKSDTEYGHTVTESAQSRLERARYP